mmetsp:Transcript_31009/g.61157  ORF Transcript_31009/g.61157 Transcript_31009/m.61157 type:complete len:231 (-) Transcript_31009:945-1637(-)
MLAFDADKRKRGMHAQTYPKQCGSTSKVLLKHLELAPASHSRVVCLHLQPHASLLSTSPHMQPPFHLVVLQSHCHHLYSRAAFVPPLLQNPLSSPSLPPQQPETPSPLPLPPGAHHASTNLRAAAVLWFPLPGPLKDAEEALSVHQPPLPPLSQIHLCPPPLLRLPRRCFPDKHRLRLRCARGVRGDGHGGHGDAHGTLRPLKLPHAHVSAHGRCRHGQRARGSEARERT